MPWTYVSASGALIRDGLLIVVGYSGFGEGKNNAAMEAVANVGPIPRGKYTIGPWYNSAPHGPMVMRLFPTDDTDTFGRGGFLIHGDSAEHPGAASHGCIILPKPVRLAIAQSGDTALEVL